MHEIELKLQVPAAARAKVAAEVAGGTAARRVRLQAAYFDTADRALAEAGLALRVRREGRRWVQTLKGAGNDGMTRAEHNVPLPPFAAAAGGAAPLADPALHAGTPVGDRLLALLASGDAAAAAGGLLCRYRTDIRRQVRRAAVDGRQATAGPPADDGDAVSHAEASTSPAGIEHGAGDDTVVELAFDEGAILADGRRLRVCELEIELLAGSPLGVLDSASQWIARHGLWLDTRSKAERGDLLARGETMAPPRRAAPLRLSPRMSVDEALRVVLLNCLDQIAANASQLANGSSEPEHVHQLRIGLRRLRSALRLFEPTAGRRAGAADPLGAARAQLAQQAADLFRGLGAARDADAIGGPLVAALGAALQSVGLVLELPAPQLADAADPAACVRAPAAQQLLLALLRHGQPGPAADAAGGDGDVDGDASDAAGGLRRHFVRWLRRWHRQVAHDARRLAALDDAARHRLRKRAKRLRYAVEFAASLYPRKAVAAYVKPLRRLQDRLGALNDVAVAIEAQRAAAADGQPHALFALGWLASQRALLLAACGPDADDFTAARRFWKHKH